MVHDLEQLEGLLLRGLLRFVLVGAARGGARAGAEIGTVIPLHGDFFAGRARDLVVVIEFFASDQEIVIEVLPMLLKNLVPRRQPEDERVGVRRRRCVGAIGGCWGRMTARVRARSPGKTIR